MFDLSYFNLGFRSDRIKSILYKLEQKEQSETAELSDAFMIISDCLKIKDEDAIISNFSTEVGYDLDMLLPILEEVFSNKTSEEAISELEYISQTIKTLENNGHVEQNNYKCAIDFFSRLAGLCLSNSVKQSMPDNMAFA